ncbi:MAG: methyltransferase type 11 [Planctomycetes bacterium]|nr:methyltransferase type 11 [Planctomycetota bacterium]
MDKFSYALVKCAVEVFGCRGPVWETGSYRVEGQEEYGDLRTLFPGVEYVGCDIRQGPLVDRIEDITALSGGDASVGTLISLNTLEHVFGIWKGFAEIARVVSDDGMAILNVPFYFKVHDYPGDYWRITPEGMAEATEAFPWRIVGSVGWETTPTTVFSVGFKKAPDDLEEKFGRFIARLEKEGPERPGPWKILKARLGYHTLGKRPFRNILHAGDVRAHLVTP